MYWRKTCLREIFWTNLLMRTLKWQGTRWLMPTRTKVSTEPLYIVGTNESYKLVILLDLLDRDVLLKWQPSSIYVESKISLINVRVGLKQSALVKLGATRFTSGCDKTFHSKVGISNQSNSLPGDHSTISGTIYIE